MRQTQVDVVVVGGGPAGMLLALLVARQGLRTGVIERLPDLARPYRGEVLQPRLLRLLQRLGLLTEVLSRPHLKLTHLQVEHRGQPLGQIPFRAIAPDWPYALWIPQRFLLEALWEKARDFPHFHLWLNAHPQRLLTREGRARGVVVRHQDQDVPIDAQLTVGADGRDSQIRTWAGFEFRYQHHGFDVLFFTLPRPPGWGAVPHLNLAPPFHAVLLPKYPDLLQAGLLLPVGQWERLQAEGLTRFHQLLAACHPLFQNTALPSWDACFPLEARIHLVDHWDKPGCLLIGDAAHCASPAGAVGVALSMETAAVAADVIAHRRPLATVQRLREPEILAVHRRQRQLERWLLNPQPWATWLRPHVAACLIHSPLVAPFMRPLLDPQRELPLSDDLGFRPNAEAA